ncbi:MAG: bifunctional proline dehydrogenase/L-glutamate gamma-semialdehyde dehydrogenase PutA [Pseudomonadota bacterium]
MHCLETLREEIRRTHHLPEADVLARLTDHVPLSSELRGRIESRAVGMVERIRDDNRPGLMEIFLAEYGLSTDEGVALICLAEALLRVPDAETIDALIEDKIAPSEWSAHLGRSSSTLVNASTWALMLTRKVLRDGTGTAAILRSAVRRLGEPVIRHAVTRAMKELGAQFVLGETIDEALARGKEKTALGYTFSYDMLGEAALTDADADAFYDAYAGAIERLAQACNADDVRRNPGISVKLSALHPRYDAVQQERVMADLVPRVSALARMAAAADMGFNIDAEEADRLDISLDVIAEVLRDPALAGWDGFGVVVQAYGKRALPVIDWIHALAQAQDRRVMVRLVKGAYWDTEIKRAQVEGLADYPVFTRKAATDVSYVCCAARLLEVSDRVYPQFATHNAHSIAAILELARPEASFEFQRLHGMGEALHDTLLREGAAASRIYAPVGAHRDLLAYLVRRLLENGANSSFVNQIVDATVPAEIIARDPFAELEQPIRALPLPAQIYAPERMNSGGFDLRDPLDLQRFDEARAPFKATHWSAEPILAVEAERGDTIEVVNPALPDDTVGSVTFAAPTDVAHAVEAALPWAASVAERAAILRRASDLYEAREGEIFALLAREAGKTPPDAIAELREAVDFLRYYAARAEGLEAPARGIFTCISPWNFPLAIFTGQIAAALAAGNGVLAKPAEATGLIAALAVRILHEAGVPRTALQLIPGHGAEVGAALTSAPDLGGVCFTGSTDTAGRINRTMATHLSPHAPLIAETGGLNAMVVDSTALPEQAVRDIVASAFQSAGQRCSALRMLYVQEDVADDLLSMLFGAMDALTIGDPWSVATDVGPVIDEAARARILEHVDVARREGRLLKEGPVPSKGTFVAPTVLRVEGIAAIGREVFGPVLHVASFRAAELDRVIDDINGTGYGLTFGIHSRIDDRVETLSRRVAAGNIYVNRNQIGAVVGSQPFGGEGLSGTGPKAGGPAYLPRFCKPSRDEDAPEPGHAADPAQVQNALDGARHGGTALSSLSLPGPTGESNRLTEVGRGTVLCLGPGQGRALHQARVAEANGCRAVCVAPGLTPDEGIDGVLTADALTRLDGFAIVASAAPDEDLRPLRVALAARSGAIIPLCAEDDLASRCRLERHVCIDITAAGGNASLLAETS